MVFLIPALIVSLVTSGWVARRHRQDPDRGWVAAGAPPALLLTTVFFLVLVLLLGYKEADRSLQQVSSGYGVLQLGVVAWLLAHAVYVTLLVGLLGPASRVAAAWRTSAPWAKG